MLQHVCFSISVYVETANNLLYWFIKCKPGENHEQHEQSAKSTLASIWANGDVDTSCRPWNIHVDRYSFRLFLCLVCPNNYMLCLRPKSPRRSVVSKTIFDILIKFWMAMMLAACNFEQNSISPVYALRFCTMFPRLVLDLLFIEHSFLYTGITPVHYTTRNPKWVCIWC